MRIENRISKSVYRLFKSRGAQSTNLSQTRICYTFVNSFRFLRFSPREKLFSCRRGKFSTNLSPSGRIRQVQNTTSCHNSVTMNLNSTRISTVRGHAPYKYPPRNTIPKSPGTNSNPLRISWSDISYSLWITNTEGMVQRRDSRKVASISHIFFHEFLPSPPSRLKEERTSE